MSLEESGLQMCTWCEGDGVVTLGGETPIRISLYKEVVETLKAAVDLIDQYEAPRKAQCGKSSVTCNVCKHVLQKAKEILKE